MNKYKVWCPELYENDAKIIEALNEKDAVKEWAKMSDEQDDDIFYIAQGNTVDVLVQKFGNKKVNKYEVCGEMIPNYFSKKLS